MSRIKAGMQDNRIKRLLSAMVVVMTIFGVVRCSFGVIAATGSIDVLITNEGKSVKSIAVTEGDKDTLSAVKPSGVDVCVYQWQVRLEDKIWVDINEQTAETIEVSDALLASVLDSSRSAYVRCKITAAGVEYVSDACKVSIAVRVEESDDTAAASSGVTQGDTETVTEAVTQATTESETTEATTEKAAESSTTEDDTEEAVATPTDAPKKGGVRRSARRAPSKSADSSVTVLSDDDIALISDEMVTVTINYLDALTHEKIFSSFRAQIEKGTGFNQGTVLSPTYVGYVPYYMSAHGKETDTETTYTTNDAGEKVAIDPTKTSGWRSAESINMVYQAVTENIVINVYYFATDVPFEARFFFQNIYDDQYTEKTSFRTKATAKTGTIIDDESMTSNINKDEFAAATKGFTKLYHYPEAVAADGSTVFQCYYDRNYYLIRFDLNGGHGVEPIYAKYDSTFVVNQPTRFGYTFAGWDLTEYTDDNDNTVKVNDGEGDGQVDVMPSTIPYGNCVYKALWTQNETTFTVVYWTENADDNGYSYWTSRTDMTATSGTTLSITDTSVFTDDVINYPINEQKTDYQYFTYNSNKTTVEEKSNLNVTIAGDGSTVFNVYYSRNQYELYFIYARSKDSTYQISSNSTNFSSGTKATTNASETDVAKMLEDQNVNWGNINKLPSTADFNDTQKKLAENGMFSLGTFTSAKGYTYYYIYCKVKYDSNMSDIWPREMLSTADVTNTYYGDVAVFSAWNVEYATQYAKDNSNVTIKGNYQRLDTTLLYNTSRAADTGKLYFLGFWENGGNNHGWNYPIKWTYNSWTPLLAEDKVKLGLSDTDVNGTEKTIDDKSYKKYNGNWYELYMTTVCSDNNTDAGSQTATKLEGYDNSKTVKVATAKESVSTSNNYGYGWYILDCYYVRNSYSLKFQNNGVQTNAYSVPYETNLATYGEASTGNVTYADGTDSGKTLAEYLIEPDYPATLEDNAYKFDGWYTTPQHIDSTKVDVDNYTMPANGVMLYAKWTKVSHTVNMFKTYDDMVAYEQDLAALTNPTQDQINELLKKHNYYKTASVLHGNILGSVEDPKLSYETDTGTKEYTFGGWFYMENESAKAFTPLDMPISKDMNVYADWGSLLPQPYTIHYALKNAPEDSVVESLNKAYGTPEENKKYELTVSGTTTTYLYVDGAYHQLVANDTTGYGYQGSTRTFTAKAGNPYNQLYESYNKGYYPTVASHSITMAYEEDKTEAAVNVYTFYYVFAKDVAYKVRYIDAETGKVLHDEKSATSNDAVVTERFQVIDGRLPDAFYKRLVLAVTEDESGSYIGSDENVITFYYTENNSQAYYAVHFMLQNINSTNDTVGVKDFDTSTGKYTGSDYTESDYLIEGVVDITDTDKMTGSRDVNPVSFSGFEEQENAYTVNKNEAGSDSTYTVELQTETGGTSNDTYTCTIHRFGTDIYVFYKRQSYNYTVYYLKDGADITGDKLQGYRASKETDETVLKLPYKSEVKAPDGFKYGTSVTEAAEKIDGYACTSSTTKTLEISDNESYNYIIFFYTTEKYTVEYKIVGDDGCGTLTKQNKTFLGSDKEADITSKATANEGYKFVGWYLDEDCTKPAGDTYTDSEGEKHVYATISNDTFTITPDIGELSPSTSIDTNVFYAKFVRQLGSLTISRTGATDGGSGDQTFVYQVKNNDTGETINVTVTGDSSVKVDKLPYGRYTVTQLDGWSWRYGDSDKQVTVSGDGKVTFDAVSTNDKWLSGNSKVKTNEFDSSYTPPKSSSSQSDETGAELN